LKEGHDEEKDSGTDGKKCRRRYTEVYKAFLDYKYNLKLCEKRIGQLRKKKEDIERLGGVKAPRQQRKKKRKSESGWFLGKTRTVVWRPNVRNRC